VCLVTANPGETDAGNLSAYIPTNLISITDGQLVMSARLFQEGQKPAIDIGTSVSRVGGKTQAPALRAATGTLRLDYAQFLELEMFSRFGGVLDARVKAQLARGATLRMLLSQPQYRPLRLCDEVALATALREGMLDGVPPARIDDFRAALSPWLDQHADAVARRLDAAGDLTPEQTTALAASVRSLAQRYGSEAA
jgi:F-type H+/Na+-transporting ATPase subunit alpha